MIFFIYMFPEKDAILLLSTSKKNSGIFHTEKSNSVHSVILSLIFYIRKIPTIIKKL
jgi:hypothetical protein